MKTYKKAEILFVSFELSQSIAAGCEAISNQGYATCKLSIPLGIPGEYDVIFTDDLNCESTTPGVADTICYDVPTADYNVYSS